GFNPGPFNRLPGFLSSRERVRSSRGGPGKEHDEQCSQYRILDVIKTQVWRQRCSVGLPALLSAQKNRTGNNNQAEEDKHRQVPGTACYQWIKGVDGKDANPCG